MGKALEVDGNPPLRYSKSGRLNMLRATVSSKGQVSIPKALREQAGLAPGTQLAVSLEDGKIVFSRLVPRLRRWRGSLAGTNALRELETDHRREIERDEALAHADAKGS